MDKIFIILFMNDVWSKCFEYKMNELMNDFFLNANTFSVKPKGHGNWHKTLRYVYGRSFFWKTKLFSHHLTTSVVIQNFYFYVWWVNNVSLHALFLKAMLIFHLQQRTGRNFTANLSNLGTKFPTIVIFFLLAWSSVVTWIYLHPVWHGPLFPLRSLAGSGTDLTRVTRWGSWLPG